MSIVAPSVTPPEPHLAASPPRPHLRLVEGSARPSPARRGRARLRRATLARGAAGLSLGLAIGFALAGAVQRPYGDGRTDLVLALLAALVAGVAHLAARGAGPAAGRTQRTGR